MTPFLQKHISACAIDPSHPVVKYLAKKTQAVDRGSKARRSLGNLYALLVLAEDYANGGEVSTFTTLMARMKSKPFGSKLQNHPLDNRLNDEFRRMTALSDQFLPVVSETRDGKKVRRISVDLLSYNNADPAKIAEFILLVINDFAASIQDGQEEFLQELKDLHTSDDLIEFVEQIFLPNSDARLFEVVSYCLLKWHFSRQVATFALNGEPQKSSTLKLYKTGRTNANDGGIDFVLQPVGRFFQVTEVTDFKKYFLDFDKINRFPISFVVKTEMMSSEVVAKVRRESLTLYGEELVNPYMSLIEDITTNNELRLICAEMSRDPSGAVQFKKDLEVNFRLEYGHYD